MGRARGEDRGRGGGRGCFHRQRRNAGEDPYHPHWYRVKLDGTGLTALTEADGNHSVVFCRAGNTISTHGRGWMLPQCMNCGARRTAD